MRFFINTVSRARVQDGVAASDARLKLLSRGDLVVFYAPHRDQKFVAIGEIAADARGRVDFLAAEEADVHPLIEQLDFIKDKKSWGLPFRRGLFEIEQADYERIAAAMNAPAMSNA